MKTLLMAEDYLSGNIIQIFIFQKNNYRECESSRFKLFLKANENKLIICIKIEVRIGESESKTSRGKFYKKRVEICVKMGVNLKIK